MVVGFFVFITAWFVFGVVFWCGFAVWASFGSDFGADDSLVTMAECCGSVVLVVDACCVTGLFTSPVFLFCVVVFGRRFVTTRFGFAIGFCCGFVFHLLLGCVVGWLCSHLC